MSFIYSKYLILIIIAVLLMGFSVFKMEKNFFSWVKNFWFFNRSINSKASTLFYLLGMSFLMFALLDLRGARQASMGEVSVKKTIVLIDSSLSMLVEDVRPSRFEKAIFMARHFMKKSSGHKISVMIFSDNTKRLVPFTGDKELLDARVSGLIDKGVSGGGSNISKAIKECLRYFKTSGKDSSGNILVFTDGESHKSKVKLKVPDNINLAVIGVGTTKGDFVPMGNSANLRNRFKKINGKKVISKVDEDYIKALGKGVDYYKYWLTSTFSLPTEDVLSFFEGSNAEKSGKESIMTRPVYAHFLMIPGVILLICAFFIKNFSQMFIHVALAIFLLPLIVKAQPAEVSPEELEKQKHLESAQFYLDKWKTEELSQSEKMKMAADLIQGDENERATEIYENSLSDIDETNAKDYFNWATGDMKSNKFRSALKKLDKINNHLENSRNVDESFKKKVRENLLIALKKTKGKKNGKGKGKDKKGKNDKKNDKLSGEKRMKELDKKNVSGVLKQILDEDRNLQKKYLDTSTKDKKGKAAQLKKDW